MKDRREREGAGRIKWATVRACMINTTTQRVTESYSAGVSGTFKPLNVWLTKGYSEEQIRASPSRADPTLGETFAVRLTTESWLCTKEKIEEEVLLSERQAAEKNRQRKSKKQNAQEDEAQLGDSDLDLPSAPTPAGSSGKATAQNEKAREREAQRERAQVARHNDRVAGLAAKVLGPLTTSATALSRAEKKGSLETLDADARETVVHQKTVLADWTSLCRLTLQQQDLHRERASGEPERLPELPFALAEVKTLQKQVAATVVCLRPPKPEPKRKPEKPAAGGDAAPPTKRRKTKGKDA